MQSPACLRRILLRRSIPPAKWPQDGTDHLREPSLMCGKSRYREAGNLCQEQVQTALLAQTAHLLARDGFSSNSMLGLWGRAAKRLCHGAQKTGQRAALMLWRVHGAHVNATPQTTPLHCRTRQWSIPQACAEHLPTQLKPAIPARSGKNLRLHRTLQH